VKTKDLKKMIQESALHEMPDVKNKINLDVIPELTEVELEQVPRFRFRLRNTMIASFSALLLLVGIFTVISLTSPDDTNYFPLSTSEDWIAFTAVSATSILENETIVDISFDATPLSFETAYTIEDQDNLLTPIVNLGETVLGDTSQILSIAQDSTNNTYMYEVLYRNVDLLGNLIEYRIRFNIEGTSEQQTMVGTIEHEGTTYTFEGTINQATGAVESLQVNSSDGVVTLSNDSTDSETVFSYRYTYQNQEEFQASLNLKETNSNLNAEVVATSTDQDLSLSIHKNQVARQLEVSYQGRYQGENMQGELTVDVEENPDTGDYEYCYQVIQNNQVTSYYQRRSSKGNNAASSSDTDPDENPHQGNRYGHMMSSTPAMKDSVDSIEPSYL